ncbi:putative ribonuclease H protein [Sesbania bispinosa]|nr:putative ribonuclease H protein [Sesbania bispinosa]
MTNSDCCPCCNQAPETNIHAIRDCFWATQIWKIFIHAITYREFFNSDLLHWLKFNFSGFHGHLPRADWPLMFACIVAGIWRARNTSIFDNAGLNLDMIPAQIHRTIVEVKLAFSPTSGSNPHMDGISSLLTSWVKWNPPDTYWIKLKTDGAVNPSHQ